jgi:energy-coupling factor transport system substrate-specific component
MQSNLPSIVLAAACISLNIAAGTLIYLLKLPIYLDSAGIMLAAILIPGSRAHASLFAAIIAVVSFILFGILVSPFEPWFIGTGIVGGLYGALVVRGHVADLIDGSAKTSRFIAKLLLFGVGWGVIAAVVSAPVIVYLFGGVTGAGPTLFVAFLVKMGHQMLTAVLMAGFSAEPVDKTLSLLLAIIMARFTPPAFRALLEGEKK